MSKGSRNRAQRKPRVTQTTLGQPWNGDPALIAEPGAGWHQPWGPLASFGSSTTAERLATASKPKRTRTAKAIPSGPLEVLLEAPGVRVERPPGGRLLVTTRERPSERGVGLAWSVAAARETVLLALLQRLWPGRDVIAQHLAALPVTSTLQVHVAGGEPADHRALRPGHERGAARGRRALGRHHPRRTLLVSAV